MSELIFHSATKLSEMIRASGCSTAGVGSGLGGSIRVPSHFCGIVGLKPTPGGADLIKIYASGGIPRATDPWKGRPGPVTYLFASVRSRLETRMDR